MDIFQSIILGIVEGITEFLPISSTGHLIIISDWLGMDQTAATKAFEVIIQLSAILAVVFNYREKFSIKKVELWKKIFVSFLPLAIVGFIFRHQIKELFSVEVVAYMFIVGGIVFLIVEKFFIKEKKKSTTKATLGVMLMAAGGIGILEGYSLYLNQATKGILVISLFFLVHSSRITCKLLH